MKNLIVLFLLIANWSFANDDPNSQKSRRRERAQSPDRSQKDNGWPTYMGYFFSDRPLSSRYVEAENNRLPLAQATTRPNRAAQEQINFVEATPNTRAPRTGTRTHWRLSESENGDTDTFIQIDENYNLALQRGIYIITEPGIDFGRIPIVNLNNTHITDDQAVAIIINILPRLQALLNGHQRYVGQVGQGINGRRTLIQRATEHNRAVLTHLNTRLYREVANMNDDTGLPAGFHAIFHNVAPQDIDLLERIMILLLDGLRQHGLNSNGGQGSEQAERIVARVLAQNRAAAPLRPPLQQLPQVVVNRALFAPAAAGGGAASSLVGSGSAF
ncbi:MAG: hypothetical protein JKY15_08075 [Deltaproteobacteria bacterium]|nr:hypothetical protein [Deltaproteobacteria bacterium]